MSGFCREPGELALVIAMHLELEQSIGQSRGEEVRREPAPDPAVRLRSLCGAALRCALVSDAAPSAGIPEVRPLLAAVCREAQEHGLAAEKLLIVLKAAWLELPEARSILRRRPDTDVLTRVITLCIAEYYRAAD